MSTISQALPSASRREAPRRARTVAVQYRPVVRLASFAALGIYGVVRWSTLLAPSPAGRLLVMLILALALAAAGALLGARAWLLKSVIAAVAVIVIFPLAGVPVSWVVHARVTATADGIDQGLIALPRASVPYTGLNEWVRVVNLLGAGLLMVCAGLVLVVAPRAVGDLRRSVAALPLIALVVVPSTVSRPHLPYLQGLVLFGLIATFVWGERVSRDDLGRVVGGCAVAGAAAMILAPALDAHRAWINPESLTSGLNAGQVERFDWSQSYGPLDWPRTGRQVLAVGARVPDYWKAEDLDVFDGHGWVSGTVDVGGEPPAPDRAALARWTQPLTVTVGAMNTSDLIAAGFASQPSNVPTGVVRGASPGTWTTTSDLGPGDTYQVDVYTPRPTAAQLAAAGGIPTHPGLAPYLSLTMPQTRPSGRAVAPQQVRFAPFGSPGRAQDVSDPFGFTGAAAIDGSPYAPAFKLAGRLAARAATPYAYVLAVERFLSRGFTYSETPPPSLYPLETFLLSDKVGYCQQFAGAMALLLRMGGIPARVAAGFTDGAYDSGSRRWLATDMDAHAWVEAWFPHYGWVRFDPTPAAAPARGGRSPIASTPNVGGGPAPKTPAGTHGLGGGGPTTRAVHGRSGASIPEWSVGAMAGLLALAALGAWIVRGRRVRTGEQLLGELERALARTGRPITGGTTLAALEHRFRGSEQAAAYIRAIRMYRYAGIRISPDDRERRALRAELRSGLGFGGTIRALWALPPRPPRMRPLRHLHWG